jgi:intein/homing endonuclease
MVYDIVIGRNKEDKERFKDKGLVFLGKGFVKMGNYTSLSNKIWMDVVRSHVILISGKRGSGKCLSGDTLISLSDGSLTPIKELENNNEKIISLDNKLKIQNSEKTDFFSREVNKMLKLKFRSGREIKLTVEHPLLTIKGWKPAQDLKIGERIATPRKTCFGNEEMPEHEIKLLAYLIAEGHTKKIVLFANSDEKIVEDFKDSLKKFDPELRLIKEKENHYRISQPKFKTKVISTNSMRNEKGQFTNKNKNIVQKRSIRKFIEKYGLFGCLSIQKSIPEKIMKLKKENLSVFLSRLFSCDGGIYRKLVYKKTGGYWETFYSSSSEKLIKQVQSLLLKFGILSKIRSKKIKLNNKIFISFELHINSSNTIKFINEIGFFGEKENKAKIAIKEIPLTKKNTNVDTIPKEIWETFKPKNWAEIGRAAGYKYPKSMRERIKYAPSRQTLLQIAKVEEYNPFYLLATSDIFWDEIMSIELLEGDFTVYDICVPQHHNFVANDIIVHNSYSIGVLAEELSNLPKEVRKNIAPLIFDTMGIFWTMKYKNEKDLSLLEDWELKSKNLPCVVWAPAGFLSEYEKRGIPVDEKFALAPAELDIEDWLSIFQLSMTEPVSVLIQKVILKLQGSEFDLDDIINNIELQDDNENTIKSAVALFEAAKSWKVFAKKGEASTKINELVTPGKTSVLDLSIYSSTSSFNVRALIIGLVSRKLFDQRILARKKEEIQAIHHGLGTSYEEKKEMPLIWLFLDEAHEFLPQKEKTPATNALVQILREGRQPGISLVLATQQPGVIHRDVMTQSDIVVSHRLTNKKDIEALNEIMQTYLLEGIKKSMNELPDLKGSAIILDDNSERLYPIRVRPRFTWHGGEAPKAISELQEEIQDVKI